MVSIAWSTTGGNGKFREAIERNEAGERFNGLIRKDQSHG
jgi:hypothetical protein